MFNKKKMLFQIWFNTAFLEEDGVMAVEKSMIDKACKDKKHKKFSKDLRIEV